MYYYHVHRPSVNQTDLSNNSTSSLNPLNSMNYQRENSPTPSQLASLINSENSKKEDETKISLKLNQAVSIPTINYFSSIPNSVSTLTDQPNLTTTTTTNTLNPLTTINSVYQNSIELKSSAFPLHQIKHDTLNNSKNDFKSNLSSCSGSCNQLIHGYYQIPKSQQTLFNNNIYSTANHGHNRNSFAAISPINDYHFNRFNLLRSSMRSTNELLSNTAPCSKVYGGQQNQSTISSLRNSLAWSPIYWSNGIVNNFNNLSNTLNNVKNLDILNNTSGQINGSLLNEQLNGTFNKPLLNGKINNVTTSGTANSLSPVCQKTSNYVHLINSPNQMVGKNEQTNLDSNFLISPSNNFDEKADQSIEDKISLYDNVDDENDCLQPLLDKSTTEQNSMQQLLSGRHVRIIDNCRDDVQHNLSLNKLCL